jgi:hypothetical protein
LLPFQNQNDDASREYLADGLTQDLVNSLGRFSALTVMSWNAVARIQGRAGQARRIARVLGVRYQVEGQRALRPAIAYASARNWSMRRGACCGRRASTRPRPTCSSSRIA